MSGESVKRESPEVAAARIEAERCRARLMGTAHELQERLSPRTLTRDAIEGVKHKGADLVEDAVDAVKNRPVATTGIVAALALFLAREPLWDLAGNLVEGMKGKGKPKKARKSNSKQDNTEAVE